MSMLMSQVERLYAMANTLRVHFGAVSHDHTILDAARQMEEAAEAIDNLRSRLTRETCRMELLFAEYVLEHECREYIMHCDACHHNFCYVLSNEDGSTWTDEPPKYCPNCGRRVVE